MKLNKYIIYGILGFLIINSIYFTFGSEYKVLLQLANIPAVYSFIWGMSEQSKEKGYHGLVGFFLSFLNILGLIILLILPDKSTK